MKYVGVDRRSPAQIFEQVIEDSQALTMACVASFDDVMIDTLMFEHTGAYTCDYKLYALLVA